MTSVPAHRRRSTYLGAGLLAGAGVLAASALMPIGSDPSTTTETEPARLPALTAPVDTEPTDTGTTDTAPADTAPDGVGPAPLSPLAAELPDRVSAVPTYVATVPPVALTIAELGVDVPVREVGVAPDGQLEIPDETEVGWYRLGGAPGTSGATVIAGHVSWNDTVGPFAELGALSLGATVDVTLADGSTRPYVVTERAQYSKLGLPYDRIWTRSGDETLVLITCGGDFNREIRRYRDNIVVYARPAGGPPAVNG